MLQLERKSVDRTPEHNQGQEKHRQLRTADLGRAPQVTSKTGKMLLTQCTYYKPGLQKQ